MMKTICITGPESSGKTILSEQLANELNAILVPEFAREYLIHQDAKYSEGDLLIIAKGQHETTQNAITLSQVTNQMVIIDTDQTVIKIWSEEKYNRVNPEILRIYQAENFDLYLLCYPDIPWTPDPLRENPNDRLRLFELYEAELKKLKKNYHIIRGKMHERFSSAIAVITRSVL